MLNNFLLSLSILMLTCQLSFAEGVKSSLTAEIIASEILAAMKPTIDRVNKELKSTHNYLLYELERYQSGEREFYKRIDDTAQKVIAKNTDLVLQTSKVFVDNYNATGDFINAIKSTVDFISTSLPQSDYSHPVARGLILKSILETVTPKYFASNTFSFSERCSKTP